MWRRVRIPLGAVAVALFGLIVLLAVLQYRWLGQISEADRSQRRATLAKGATDFAQDFDREITRAYLLFQSDPGSVDGDLDARFASRYDHWQATSRFPRLLKEFYAFSQPASGTPLLRRYDPATRTLVSAEWPASMSDWRERLPSQAQAERGRDGDTMFIRRIPPPIWDSVPAIVAPTPVLMFTPGVVPGQKADPKTFSFSTVPGLQHLSQSGSSYSILVIDKDYVSRDLLPSLAQRYFSQHREGESSAQALDFKVAVVPRQAEDAGGKATGTQPPVFQSASDFAPKPDAASDATADLFQVRTQDFTSLVSEVRRFTAFTATKNILQTPPADMARIVGTTRGAPMSIVIQQTASPPGAPSQTSTRTTTRLSSAGATPLWTLVIAHPSGSLEVAIDQARHRNLIVSFSILGVLGASLGLLVLATRRAERLARQQMEFVATVSHELRTPLAVIRSAADNLADGVVDDEERIRRYGVLMRNEGRRLSEMVEQILEIAGIQSGQRGFMFKPIAVGPLIHDILSSSSSLIEHAGVRVDVDLPESLPSVAGDEVALRRVFQNLVDNAIKYGASGGSITIGARRAGQHVLVSIADRGIGIDPADHAKIFEPFYRAPAVVAAQMQGAGLGLSLVQRIVAAHGGKVTVKSELRHGSEFIVQLPIAPADSLHATDDASAPDTGRAAAQPRFS